MLIQFEFEYCVIGVGYYGWKGKSRGVNGRVLIKSIEAMLGSKRGHTKKRNNKPFDFEVMEYVQVNEHGQGF